MAKRYVLRVMPDWHCWPIWNKRAFDVDDELGEYNIDPANLPISPQLVEALNDWAARFDATLDPSDPASAGFPTETEERQFIDDGRGLARQLAVELGDEWCVAYVHDLAHDAGGTRHGDEENCLPSRIMLI
jgi:hypothetical protein